ncbi:MAG: hypothetical protein RR420_00780 [Anaerovoracaceae bacterium]
MHIQTNQIFNVTLSITGSGGEPVIDTPVCTIMDTQTGKYFNGIEWTTTLSSISMAHTGGGLYVFNFTPVYEGTFFIRASASANLGNLPCTELYLFVHDKIQDYKWKIGTSYTVTQVKRTPIEIVTCMVKKELLGVTTWFDGTTFISSQIPIVLSMTEKQNSIVELAVPILDEGKYSIVTRPNNMYSETYNVVGSNVADIQPIIISNTSFSNQDGTDSTILDDKRNPIKDIYIRAYDMATTTLVSEAYTNANGAWSLALRPAKYMFIFEKEGYASVSFERTVR